MTVFGDDYPTRDGTCVRDYIHVADLATAHLLALDALDDGPVCRACNLGCGGNGYSVREVIDTARRVIGMEIPVRIAGRRPGDPAMLVASSEQIRRDLGWTPERQVLDTIHPVRVVLHEASRRNRRFARVTRSVGLRSVAGSRSAVCGW